MFDSVLEQIKIPLLLFVCSFQPGGPAIVLPSMGAHRGIFVLDSQHICVCVGSIFVFF